jgi:RNA polymerase sigma factor (sigma-70 family)
MGAQTTGPPAPDSVPANPLDRGWSEQLTRLYAQEFDPMVRLAYLMTRDTSGAHYLVQESFCRLAIRLRSGGVDNAGGYLRTIVVRACLDKSRQRLKERQALRSIHAARPRAGSAMTEPMWDVLDGLSAEQRAAVVLRFWLDLPLEEISRLCDCPVSTVNSRLRRALDSLRKVVQP